MRLSDGMILEYDWGFVIRQENGNFVHCSACMWSYLYDLENTMLKNENILSKIEHGQQKLQYYSEVYQKIKRTQEASDGKSEEEQSSRDDNI